MSNQKKGYSELGLAKHGYPEGEQPRTLKEIEKLIADAVTSTDESIRTLKAVLNNVVNYSQPISTLLTIPLSEFIELKYDCCLVPSFVKDYPADLKADDSNAYVFTNRNAENGVQILIGAKSGIIATRRMNNSALTEWQYSNNKGISYATFSINPQTRHLIMHTEPGYSGANFSLKNGHLIVTI